MCESIYPHYICEACGGTECIGNCQESNHFVKYEHENAIEEENHASTEIC